MRKTNITLRVDEDLVKELRKRKVNLSEFFNDASNILIFKKEAYLNISENKLEFA